MISIAKKADLLASPLLISLAFIFPLTTSGGSISAMLVVLAWFLSRNFGNKFDEIKSNPVTIAVLCYILLHIVGLLWSDDLNYGVRVFQKQWKLLLLPIFLAVVRKEHVKYYLSAFIAAIVLKASKAYLVWLDIIALPDGSTFTTEGTSHVIYNPMLALAIYIVLNNLIFQKNKPLSAFLKSFLLLFLACNMFITVGRTGHVAFFVLITITLIQLFYKTSKKNLLIGLALLPVLIFAIFQFSPTFKSRIDTAISEIQKSDAQMITSMGCRMWFYQNTIRLIKAHPLTGTGTGDFPTEYAKINRIYSPNMPETNNPHNQYLLVTSQFGFMGLIILLGIFVTQFMSRRNLKDNLTQLRQAFPIFFIVIMLAESYLQIHATGLLFSIFSSFLYKDFSHATALKQPHLSHE